MHPDPTWIVVADRQAARFFLRSRWGDPIKEFPDLAESADFLDRRSARSSPVTASGFCDAAPPGSNPDQDDDERKFLHRVANEIDEVMDRHSAQGLVICAPPNELCLLRDYISERTRAKLSCEITRDFVNEKASRIDTAMRRLKV